jgi:predicted transcriptional regulator YheO
MSHNMDYLHRKRIIYKRQPLNDEPTAKYNWGWYYENGTHEYYALFHSKSLITSYRSLKWHFYVLLYLNQNLNEKEFTKLAKFIADKKNGFISFNIDNSVLDDIIKKVLEYDLSVAPNNRARKVIFKDGTGLSTSDKLKITGSLIGRNKNASASDIYEIMLYLHEQGEKITIKKIAESLKVTPRTIYRNITDELKKEKDLLNETLQS